jgi:Protein of unknown function (DUF2752)
MIPFLQVRPCAHASHRTSRLQMLGSALTGFAVLAIWNPVVHPGPSCCLLRWAVGLPCPLCGMTRGMALCERGRFLEATWYNPLAVPVFAAALVLCLKWAFEFTTKQSVVVVLRPAWNRALWVGVYAVLLAAWVYLLVFRREDDFAGTWVGQMMHCFWP